MKVPQFSWDMKGDDRPDETIDSGMGTLQSCRTDPALESRLPDTILGRGARDVNASMSVLGQNHRFGPRTTKFTNTEVLEFRGVTCWDQYRQVRDAIVRSNGWEVDMVTLQLLSHLEGDALNVTLLVPEAQRATRIGLVSALNDHYRSTGRLMDYRRKFIKTVHRDGEDLSIFATELETLAVQAFGDIGPSERFRMIHDRFITGSSPGLRSTEASR